MPGSLAQAIGDADKDLERKQPLSAMVTKIVNSPSGDPRRGIYRISVPIPEAPPMLPQGFTFNQFLVVDTKPLLYHTGPKGTFAAVSAAVASVMPLSELAYVTYAHCEADECGAMNQFLEAVPNAVAVCSGVECATYASDAFIRPPTPLKDGQEVPLGEMTVKYLWTPHTPHGWGTAFMFETATKTLFAGDLFTQHGINPEPVQQAKAISALDLKLFDITDYWVWHRKSAAHLERLAALHPSALLVMHGSSFTGEGCTDMIKQLSELRQGMEH